jgi:hypothetical protein
LHHFLSKKWIKSVFLAIFRVKMMNFWNEQAVSMGFDAKNAVLSVAQTPFKRAER